MVADADVLIPTPRWTQYAGPIVSGLAILLVGVGSWPLLARLNLRIRPDLPWAAAVMVLILVAMVAWLHGVGPPSKRSVRRRWLLRLTARDRDSAAGPETGILLVLLLLLYVVWTFLSRQSGVPDLSDYPTTAYRWSSFLMGGLTAGVVEEVAFRGYMQSGLERIDPRAAVWITSLVFVAAHLTHGIGAVLLLGPGLFATSMLYGTLTQRLGTIAPGILIHSLGDLGRTYFGVLGGDSSLLFVP